MELTIIILIMILAWKLGEKGKVYRVERQQNVLKKRDEQRRTSTTELPKPLTEEEVKQMQQSAKEEEYRKDLRKQGYTDELITTILPTLMNDGK